MYKYVQTYDHDAKWIVDDDMFYIVLKSQDNSNEHEHKVYSEFRYDKFDIKAPLNVWIEFFYNTELNILKEKPYIEES